MALPSSWQKEQKPVGRGGAYCHFFIKQKIHADEKKISSACNSNCIGMKSGIHRHAIAATCLPTFLQTDNTVIINNIQKPTIPFLLAKDLLYIFFDKTGMLPTRSEALGGPFPPRRERPRQAGNRQVFPAGSVIPPTPFPPPPLPAFPLLSPPPLSRLFPFSFAFICAPNFPRRLVVFLLPELYPASHSKNNCIWNLWK